jgi:hypothetical protein
VHRTGAKGLDVAAGRVRAAGLLGDCLAEVPTTPLVAVPDRLLAAADRVLDGGGIEAARSEEALEGQRAGRLAGEVLEEHARGEALVEVVRGEHRTGEALAGEERQRAVLRCPPVEAEELELVCLLHAPVELGLVDYHPVRAFGPRLDRVAPAGALDLPEPPGVEVADERLVGRVREDVLEGAKGAGEPTEEPVAVRRKLARRLRPVPNEVGRMGEDERAGMNGRAPAHDSVRLSSQVATLPAHPASHACAFSRYARA